MYNMGAGKTAASVGSCEFRRQYFFISAEERNHVQTNTVVMGADTVYCGGLPLCRDHDAFRHHVQDPRCGNERHIHCLLDQSARSSLGIEAVLGALYRPFREETRVDSLLSGAAGAPASPDGTHNPILRRDASAGPDAVSRGIRLFDA